jgi:hypothetical protein
MKWISLKTQLPQPMEECLVWIDGHRSPSWRNNHALVAYRTADGEWFEERHPSKTPLHGILFWSPIEPPQ